MCCELPEHWEDAQGETHEVKAVSHPAVSHPAVSLALLPGPGSVSAAHPALPGASLAVLRAGEAIPVPRCYGKIGLQMSQLFSPASCASVLSSVSERYFEILLLEESESR